VHSRPDILAAEASLHAANARVGVATANLYPQLQLSGSWGSESYQRSEFLRSPTTVWGIAAGLTEPLFAGGSLIGQERAANAQLEAARERYRATVLKAFQNVADVLRTLDEDATALAAREDALEAASHFYLETRARHALGAQTALAELSSEQSWQAERVNQLESAAARLVDSAALFEAVGAPEH
jgi:outer membrane protein TolC